MKPPKRLNQTAHATSGVASVNVHTQDTRCSRLARTLFPDLQPTLPCPCITKEKANPACPVCDGNGEIARTMQVTAFEPAHPLCPSFRRNDNYLFQEDPTVQVLRALEKPKRNKVWIVGDTGCGKTDLVVQIAARTGRGLVIVDCNAYTTKSQLTGRVIVRDGRTDFVRGPVVRAMETGSILLLNEIDTLSPDCLNVLKPVFEDPSTIRVEDAAEYANAAGYLEVIAHPDFRAVATSNTRADGDSGKYVNAGIQSDADRRRFTVGIAMSYPSANEEATILKRCVPDLTDEEAATFARGAAAIRESNPSVTLSTGQLIAWAETFIACGSVQQAAYTAFLTLWPVNTHKATVVVLERIFV